MNSPDIHLNSSARDDEECGEVILLRAQIADLSEKIKSIHAKWSTAGLISLAGLLAPVALIFICNLLASWSDDRFVRHYFDKIERIADAASVDHTGLNEKNIGKTLREIEAFIASDKNPEELRKKLDASLKEADSKLVHDQDELLNTYERAETFTFVGAALAIWVLPILYLLWISQSKRIMERAKFKLEYKIVEAKSRQLQDKLGEDFFTRLVQINFKYLDQYYFQTHRQANNSFGLAVAAAVVGLVLVVAAIGMVLFKRDDPARLTAIVGGLSQFIAAVFFYLHNRTVLKMGEYHKKLVLTQNIGIALKVTDLLPPEDKAQTQRALVSQLTFNINQFLSEIDTAAPLAAHTE